MVQEMLVVSVRWGTQSTMIYEVFGPDPRLFTRLSDQIHDDSRGVRGFGPDWDTIHDDLRGFRPRSTMIYEVFAVLGPDGGTIHDDLRGVRSRSTMIYEVFWVLAAPETK